MLLIRLLTLTLPPLFMMDMVCLWYTFGPLWAHSLFSLSSCYCSKNCGGGGTHCIFYNINFTLFLQQWSTEGSECSTESPSKMAWTPITGGQGLQGGIGLDNKWASKQSSLHWVGPRRPWWDHQYPSQEESFISQM